jgi:hypothetical protein
MTAYYGYPVPPMPPPRRRRRGLRITLAVAGLLVLAGVAGTVAYVVTRTGSKTINDINKEINAVKTDIRITSCTLDRNSVLSTVKIEWTVTNTGSRTRTYTPTFDVEDTNGTRLGQTIGLVTGLNPGQAVKKTSTVLLTDKNFKGKVRCKVNE